VTTATRSTPAPLPTSGRGAVASYERISRFKEDRSGAEVERGVDRQHTDARKAADYLGLGPVDRYTDNDRSASEFRTKERERWEDLLEDVRAGRHTHVMFWLFDRAFRTTDDAGRFLAACKATGTLIVQTGGWSPVVVNPADPEDVRRMKDAANQAEYEVAKMSMRQRRHKEAMAEAGASPGGRRRFGYEHGMTAPREGQVPGTINEAAVVRDLVDRFLAGESLRTLATWLNTEGIPTPSTEYRVAKGQAPAKWTGPNLRGMLAGPHLAGLRVHQGKVVGKGKWTALIPVETHDHVVAMLANPARRPKGAGNARRWLLSGLALCDECGTPLRARPAHTTRRGHTIPPSYYCPTGSHVHRRVDMVDAVVEESIVGRLEAHDTSGLFVDDAAAGEVIRLREARAALNDRMDEYVAAVASMAPAAYAAATNRLQADMDALDVALIEAATKVRQASRVLAGAIGPTARDEWFGVEGDPDRPGWSLARKRSLIAELAEVRLIGGRTNTTPKGSRFNPEDVVVVWA
jgi:site-specific DNA recombinase